MAYQEPFKLNHPSGVLNPERISKKTLTHMTPTIIGAAIAAVLSFGLSQSAVGSQGNGLGLDDGLDNDIVVVEAIVDAKNLVANATETYRQWPESDKRKVRRAHLAIRVAGERRVHQATTALFELESACEGVEWRTLSLEVMGALKKLNIPREWFVEKVSGFAEDLDAAVNALTVLGSEPTGEVLELADSILGFALLHRQVDLGRAHNAIARAKFQIAAALKHRRRVESLIASGSKSQAFRELLQKAGQGFASSDPDLKWAATKRIYSPSVVWSVEEIMERLPTERENLRLALESMSWWDFSERAPEVRLPEDADRIVESCRNRLREMFPELR